MDIMNILRTGMNMSISRIHIWLCYILIHGSLPTLLMLLQARGGGSFSDRVFCLEKQDLVSAAYVIVT